MINPRSYRGTGWGCGYGSSNYGSRRSCFSNRYEETVEGHHGLINYGPIGSRPGVEVDESVLRVTKIDYLVRENTVSHHTDEYGITEEGDFSAAELVVRRGQSFDLEFTFSKPFDVKENDIRFLFEIGTNPLPSKGTRVELLMSDKDLPDEWGAAVKKQSGNKLTVTIFTPSDCLVGKWSFSVDSLASSTSSAVYRFRSKQKIYMLFNPWNKKDQVYMAAEDDRDEYVMNDTGKIYIGAKNNISARPWVFGQFDGFVLDCAIYLLDSTGLGWSARGDPIKTVRKLTSICNSFDNDGVLAGNWSGDYSGGATPTSWTGSPAILEKFYISKEPVMFGQCWVFSGILTTVCRTLGIPARSVTNFASAHDADCSITIDCYWNENGERLSELNEDSIWNFHVWNEAWMARPDLPPGYGGWQAIDATPQETSEGVFCCGPASLTALKKGEVNLPYDGGFIFAEVNADRIHWVKSPDGSWKKIFQKNSVGKNISTKKKGSEIRGGMRHSRFRADPDREDLTLDYKFKEGSEEERCAVLMAQKTNPSPVAKDKKHIYCDEAEDVIFELSELEEIEIGMPFEVKVACKNISAAKRNISVTLTAQVISYTGVPQDVIARQTQEVTMKPNERHEVKMHVDPDDYLDCLDEHSNVNMSCMAKVAETKQVYVSQDDFKLLKPELTITGDKLAYVGKAYKVTFSFRNPLNRTLTKCQLMVEGPGLQNLQTFDVPNIKAGENFSKTIELVPKKPGQKGKSRQLIATFSSRQLEAVDGIKNILVQKA